MALCTNHPIIIICRDRYLNYRQLLFRDAWLALINQMLVKKLISGCKWISCIDVHPSGDHLIVGSYDRRVAWFDLDLSSTPYKTLKYHTKVTC